MGYHVTILRTSGKKRIPFSREEVNSVERAFPMWSYKENDKALVPKDGEDIGALWFSEGVIWTKNPSEETIKQMLLIAEHLHARVRGDELETYRTPTETYLHPDDAEEHKSSREEVDRIIRRTRIKSFVFHSVVASLFIGLILLFKLLGWIK